MKDLIYDWNRRAVAPPAPLLVDQTLALARRAPSAQAPRAEDELALLDRLAAVGCRRVVLAEAELVPEARSRGIEPALWRPGPARLLAERVEAIPEGFEHPVTLVCRDAGRVEPEALARFILAGLERGADSFCLADDSGHCLRAGVRRLVQFARRLVGDSAALEWYGGNQRDLALSNALEAWREGVDAVHASVFGLGPGAGLLATELWLVNLRLYGALTQDLSQLNQLCLAASAGFGVEIYPNRPVVGADAFRTGTGVHAAAIIKARAKGDEDLADLIYSGVPARAFGFHQIIEVGPMAGASNVHYWLESHGRKASPEAVARILERAKASNRVLSDAEILEALEQ